jgi:hypothetical protein
MNWEEAEMVAPTDKERSPEPLPYADEAIELQLSR